MNQTLKVTLIGITSALAFAATATKAQALEFDFSFNGASGRIGGLDDNTSDQAASYVWLTTPVGETFDLSTAVNNSFTVAAGELTTGSFVAEGFASPTQLRIFPGSPDFGTYGAAGGAVTYTPVPFGVEADMGILILGGMWGASRLRKKMAAK